MKKRRNNQPVSPIIPPEVPVSRKKTAESRLMPVPPKRFRSFEKFPAAVNAKQDREKRNGNRHRYITDGSHTLTALQQLQSLCREGGKSGKAAAKADSHKKIAATAGQRHKHTYKERTYDVYRQNGPFTADGKRSEQQRNQITCHTAQRSPGTYQQQFFHKNILKGYIIRKNTNSRQINKQYQMLSF